MPTNSAYENSNEVYKYTASMQFIKKDGDKHVNIDNYYIKSIVVEYDYDGKNMPLIFVTASLDKNIIDDMAKYKDTGTMVLNIQRCIFNSDTPDLFTDYISDKFVYFLTDNINTNDELDYTNQKDRKDIFKIITFGLMSLNLINKNKKVVNGSINGSMTSILYRIMGHLPLLIEPLTHDATLTRLVLPPLNSISKMVKYLNNYRVFYDTSYRFFMDFDTTYLLSSSGNPVLRKGETIDTAMLFVRKGFDDRGKVQGMITDTQNAMYKIDINTTDCQLTDYHSIDKSYSDITAIASNGQKISKKAVDNKAKYLEDKTNTIRLPNDNIGLLDNMKSSIVNSSVQVLLSKTDINSSVITPNKRILLSASEQYGDVYDGRYLLASKRELYIREDELFSMSTILLLRQIII